MARPRIVVLGAGFGGAYCAHELEKRRVSSRADVFLIDRHNFLTFYPLLVEAGTGNLEPRHTVVPIRGFLRSAEFRMGEVLGIHVHRQSVTYRVSGTDLKREVPYDHLVVALGSVTRLPDLPGLRKYSFGMKSLTDAVALRDRAIQMLERADAVEDPLGRQSILRLVVVGGNFTGVEVAGEFQHFLREASRFYRNVRAGDCNVTLIEIADRILQALDPELSRFAAEHMRKRGIEILLSESVKEVQAERVILQSGGSIPSQTVIWCAGIAPNPLLEKAPFPVDGRGYILCERDLRVRGFENVWAIGDCAVNLDPEGRPYPATAQHAVREGKQLARNLERVLKGLNPEPCDISSRGALAAIGCRTGVASVFGIKVAGFPAWFLYRTTYLLKIPGWSRKARVALDWTVDLLFSRDYVQLGIHRGR